MLPSLNTHIATQILPILEIHFVTMDITNYM